MARKRYTAQQTITKLREAEVELAKGQTTPQVCKKLGISDQLIRLSVGIEALDDLIADLDHALG